MSQHFNTAKAQRKMVRAWCRENGVYTNSHPDNNLTPPISETYNGVKYNIRRNFNTVVYPGIQRNVWVDWTGQSLEELSLACAYIRMTQPPNTGIVVMVRTPEPTRPSRAKHGYAEKE